MTTKITEKNISNLANAGVQWQSVFYGDGSTALIAIAGQGYFIDTTSGTVSVTLPASPIKGDTITISDYGANASTNNIRINPNGNKILGGSSNRFIQTNKETVKLIYSDNIKGWSVASGYIEGTLGLQGSPAAPTIGTATLSGSDVSLTFTAPTDTGDSPILSYAAVSNPAGGSGTISEDGSTRTILVTGLSTGTSYTFTVTATNAIGTSAASAASNSITTPSPSFLSATGGTVATSGDFKIHTFTGDGCFVVSTAGNPVGPQGGPSIVDYLVVAGGGGGGGSSFGGGGGGGGFREGKSSPAPIYSASPIVAPAGLTVTATTYPITVGAGGAGGACAVQGTPSVFSTITSAGGGKGPAGPGGSGGGGSHQGAGGNGNTPPVSPSQGFPGGMTCQQSPPTPTAGRFGSAGGGGAAEAGIQSTCAGYSSVNGRGGAGVATAISGSPTSYSGGGGGGPGYLPGAAGSPCGTGGASGSAGTTNRGGGGGGDSAAGGKGIIIIRYKFQ